MALRLLRRYGSAALGTRGPHRLGPTGCASTGRASTGASIPASSVIGQHERHETTEYKARECQNFK
jgi:hypothetical protein